MARFTTLDFVFGRFSKKFFFSVRREELLPPHIFLPFCPAETHFSQEIKTNQPECFFPQKVKSIKSCWNISLFWICQLSHWCLEQIFCLTSTRPLVSNFGWLLRQKQKTPFKIPVQPCPVPYKFDSSEFRNEFPFTKQTNKVFTMPCSDALDSNYDCKHTPNLRCFQ